jgi:hypothetical protein
VCVCTRAYSILTEEYDSVFLTEEYDSFTGLNAASWQLVYVLFSELLLQEEHVRMLVLVH